MAEPKTRNASIELFRLVLMFGICLLHACIKPGYCKAWFVNLTPWCVTAFAFVSGYFGARFKVSKILRLEGLALFCACACALGDFSKAWSIFGGYWFLHAYVLMLCFAPIVDKVVEAIDDGMLLIFLPILLAVYGWSFAPTLPIIGKCHIPLTPGLEAYSGLTLLAAYIFARIYRKYGLENRLKTLWMLLTLPPLFALSALGVCEYNSIIALCLSAVTFTLFKRLTLPNCLGKAVLFMAPSVFAIYLLHQPNIGIETSWVQAITDSGVSIYLAYAASASVMFVLAILVDLPRRMAAHFIMPSVNNVLKTIDVAYDRSVIFFDNFLRGGGNL